MSFDPATATHLKPWLVRTLEPICDAEPGALADYILALLKHNVPENDMRKELTAQLDEFLEKECSSFIDTLFTVLRTKSYLPYVAPPSPSYPPTNPPDVDTGIPIPLDGLLSPSMPTSSDRTRKRSIDNDDRNLRPPAKGPRINSEGQFSRYSNGSNMAQESRSTGGWGGRGDRHEMQDMNGHRRVDSMTGPMAGGMNGSMGLGQPNGMQSQAYRPPDQKRGICRDYHNNGYCARGAFCKFSHGDDAVVPGQLFSMAGPSIPGPLPFMQLFPNGGVPFAMGAGAGAAYDPHEARMDMRPHMGGMTPGARPQARAPLLPRLQQEDGNQNAHSIHASGELPVIQDLTPNPPPDVPSQNDVSQEFGLRNDTSLDNVINTGAIQVPPPRPMSSGPMDVDGAMPMPSTNGHGSFRSGARGGRGRGTFVGESHNFHQERKNDKTLVVEKIPDDKLSLDAVNGWFKRFGTVTNVAVDSANAKALVSFSKHEEAHAAWKSEDAVFNNRFVKVFWHRPMDGHGHVGARMLAASAPLVASISSKEIIPAPPAHSTQPSTSAGPTTSIAAEPRKVPTTSTSVSELAAKQRLLEQQIAEQKSLMAKLAIVTPDEKKQIMTRLRSLGEEMKAPTTSTNPSTSIPSTQKQAAHAPRSDAREQKERERLDRELELHNAALAVEGEVEESTEDLKAKLERLKAEAASLGISDTAPESTYGGSYRPYRGRGRGTRGFYRGVGRGSLTRGSMKLDNRPKKLLVRGVSSDNVQAVRDWYETTGQMGSVETVASGDIIVTFRTRNAAEQGLSKGNNIPPMGPVQVSWFVDPQLNRPTQKVAQPTPQQYKLPEDKDTSQQARSAHLEPPPISPHLQEEEVIASGWGGEGDDGDGMGLL